MIKKSIPSATLIAILSIGYANAQAATATSTMLNTVTITNSCSIVAVGFTTTYDPIVTNATTNQDVTAIVTTNCTVGATPVITLGQGANSNTGSTDAIPLRRLTSGGGTPSFLNYSLFSDTGRTVTWGNTAATAPTAVVATAVPTISTIYARVPFGQTSTKAAVYTDSVVATVTF
ncbi:spore coat protein U domain-containing protein [Glaciimonas sp. CA11.2]|uniref:spore coat protein U domain-containing protein n=1 Tax=unclassified Glaciimonas TaxID=2644401 RepID=UPI002AB47386|nr:MULTISPECIES: spore coat protein U domain-containing protein [unclassified Glaciimonas]MDY7546693.1 spore coat protein U domain-containing protein [Glaciimonas sp. CA11.2]MEB0011816.1 spore coat protein U domain-containing protein [Glaciimonas sp. Cout2]MEB0162273.1 spore coat protein U domain-containing protein [Glaciimonas sp. CA11.2]